MNAKRKLDDTRQAVKYISRYLARAGIAEYRIIKYENNRVKFWYEDHNDGLKKVVECDVLEFIGKITLYNFVKQRNIDELIKEKNRQNEVKKSWKQRIIESFEKNPLLFNKCGTEKFLWKIWHKDYGVIYDIRETNDRKDILYEPKRDKVQRKVLQMSLL